jgi:hypothetical protein
MSETSKMAIASVPNNGLISRTKAVNMVKEYKQRFAAYSPQETRYVSFSARRLFTFMYQMIADEGATDFRIYFSKHDESLLMRNPRIPSPPNTDDYLQRTTLVIVALKPNNNDNTILNEIDPDEFIFDEGLFDRIFQDKSFIRAMDFATLCPPHAQHQQRVSSQDSPLSIYDEVYNTI